LQDKEYIPLFDSHKKDQSREMRLKGAKRYQDWMEDLKPVTDEEFEELLNEPPKKNRRKRKR